MALFNKKKADTAPAKEAQTHVSLTDLSHVLKHPRITEKATMHQGMSVYVFDIAPSANKKQVAAAVEKYYKVRPRMVRVTAVRAKRTRNRRTGALGSTSKAKKAYVYLKHGETITIT